MDIAKRLVEHDNWRWVGGMLALTEAEPEPSRMYASGEATAWVNEFPAYGDWPADNDCPFGSPHYPDLTDPATVGCLLAMAMEGGMVEVSDERMLEMARRIFGAPMAELGMRVAEVLLEMWEGGSVVPRDES
jgi:hypothetical protein